MLLFFISAVCVALAVWTGFSILNTVMFALYGQELLFPTMVFWGVVSFFGIVICAALYADYRHKNQKPPGFTTLVYRKIKHKMCFEINFK